nr:hypothetical protein [Tanacetum cinerariifolium]
MFDELLNPPPSVVNQVPKAIAPIVEVIPPVNADSTGSPSSTMVEQDAPSTSNSTTPTETQSLIIPQDVGDDNLDMEVAHMGSDLLFDHPLPHHNRKWMKDHPLNNSISQLSKPVSTRLQLYEQVLFCYYEAFLTSVEPKTYKEALTQSCWIEAMQEELHEFERLEVWELVPRPNQVMADIGIFIGYAPAKKAFRIYNRRTRRIVETIHVDVDELTAMASEQHKTQSSVIPQDVRDDNLDMEIAHMGNDPLFGVPIPEVTFAQSTTPASPQAIVQTNHQMPHHNSKWTKDHPLNNIIGQLDRPISTRTMATTIEQQVTMDEALVPSAQRLRIGRSNFCLPSDIQSKEPTLQVIYDVLYRSPFFRAFLVTADVPEIYMQEFWETAKRREAYTAHSNPRGFIYQNKDKKNRLMRIDELDKFSDGTLNDVRNALDDRLKGIGMQYLTTTIWRKGDKDRAAAVIQAIDKMLKTQRIMRSLERTMDTTIKQQLAMDEALVPTAHRLKIGKSNFRLLSDIKSKESTLQLVYDVLRRCLFFKAFLVTADDPSIPRRNKVNWHYVRDDFMFSMIKLVSRHQNTQQFGAMLPIELKNDEIRNSKAYTEYYAIAIGEAAPKPKASVRRTRSSYDTSITPPTAAASPRLTTSTKGKQTTKASKAKSLSALSEVAMTEAQQMKLVTKRSMQQTHISQPSGSGVDEGTGTMDTTIKQQLAMDEALVPTAQRLKIGKSNFR